MTLAVEWVSCGGIYDNSPRVGPVPRTRRCYSLLLRDEKTTRSGGGSPGENDDRNLCKCYDDDGGGNSESHYPGQYQDAEPEMLYCSTLVMMSTSRRQACRQLVDPYVEMCSAGLQRKGLNA